jgi:hypothetical protein
MKSRVAIVALVTMVALLTSVMAQSRKVLVLPLDGNAPAAQRTKLNESVAKLSKDQLGGDVTVGDTTFAETAAAVGCDPEQPACAETVRTTLQVDELVYGSAKTADGSTTVIVTRASAGTEPKSQISVISETDSGEQAEANLVPLFTTTAATGSQEGSGSAGSGSGSGSETARPRPTSNFFDTRERKLGVAFGAGGVIALAVGLSLWSSASGLQDQIDAAPDGTLAQINSLKDLEDRAGSKALWGNVFFVVGVAAIGVGGYFLWKDHKNRSATVAPVPTEDGAGMTLVLGGRW